MGGGKKPQAPNIKLQGSPERQAPTAAARARPLSGAWRFACGRAQTLANRAGHLFNAPVLQQQALNRPATYSGGGLHSCNRVTMTFLPSPANTGSRLRRLTLAGNPELEARVENF